MWVFRRCDGRRFMGRWIVWSASMGRTRVVDSRSRRSSASARADAAGVGPIVWPCVAAWGFCRARCGRDKTCLWNCGTLWMFRGKSRILYLILGQQKGTRAPLYLDPFPITYNREKGGYISGAFFTEQSHCRLSVCLPPWSLPRGGLNPCRIITLRKHVIACAINSKQ